MFSKTRLLLVPALLLVTACNIDQPITKRATFSVNSESELCTTSKKVIDLGDDETFTKYRDQIKSVELQDVTVKITNPKTRDDSAATKAGGTLSLSADEAGTPLTLATYQDLALTAGNSQEITFDGAAATEMARLILDPPNTFYVHSNGCADAVPAFFDFEVAMTLMVHAKLM
jgi:hypothetical protein